MKPVRFKQVDVFTGVPFKGNPVAVVLEGGGLQDKEMQGIANWTNLSETTFVLPSTVADYRLRIFTPRQELPFAGHPTIGSAHAVLEAGLVKPRAGKFNQECGAGIIELTMEEGAVWLKAPPATVSPVSREKSSEVAKILGCGVVGDPLLVNVGPTWLVADVASADVLGKLVPDMQRIAELSERLAMTGITLFGSATGGQAAIHVRSFAPAHGIPEDPVCGSGNISVAVYLLKSRQMKKFGSGYVARQGMQLGRDGEVSIRVEGQEVFLGGRAVTCVEGSLRLA